MLDFKGRGRRLHLCQWDISGHPCTTIHLHGAVRDFADHPGSSHLDHGDLLKIKRGETKATVQLHVTFMMRRLHLFASSPAARGVQGVSSLQRQQTGLLYHQPAFCDPVGHDLLQAEWGVHFHNCPPGGNRGAGTVKGRLTCWYSFFPNVLLEAALWQSSSRASSAIPTALMQWCSLPGPRRPWEISNPRPSPGNKRNSALTHRGELGLSPSDLNLMFLLK